MRAVAWLDPEVIQEGDAEKYRIFDELDSRLRGYPVGTIYVTGPDRGGETHAAAYNAALTALMEFEPRVAVGHAYKIEII